MTKATLQNYRQSPRKVRKIADLVRGKNVETALNLLRFADKKAAVPVRKLIESAVANAKNLNIGVNDLVVKEIRVDGGAILYRRRPTARGRAFPIRKRTSHVIVVLEEKMGKVVVAPKVIKADKVEKKEKLEVAKKTKSKKAVVKNK